VAENDATILELQRVVFFVDVQKFSPEPVLFIINKHQKTEQRGKITTKNEQSGQGQGEEHKIEVWMYELQEEEEEVRRDQTDLHRVL
jgi:hypothetical protein